jgi:hypothetical protein
MAVSIADLAITEIMGIDDPLTGVKRHDFVELVIADKTGLQSVCSCECTKAGFVNASQIMEAVGNVSDGVICEVRLVTRIKDFSFDPASEAAASSDVSERGVLKLRTKKGLRTFSWPSVRDDLVTEGRYLIVDPGIILDNPVQNLIDEFTGRGVFNAASMLIDHDWATANRSAFMKPGRSYIIREKH